MPAMHFYVTWPDGSTERCYSPSTVVTDYLTPGTTYPLKVFAARSENALQEASNRVQQKFGYHCSSAMDQLAQIKSKIASFPEGDDLNVTVIKIVPV